MFVTIIFPPRPNNGIVYEEIADGPISNIPGIRVRMPGVRFRVCESVEVWRRGTLIAKAQVCDWCAMDQSVGLWIKDHQSWCLLSQVRVGDEIRSV